MGDIGAGVDRGDELAVEVGENTMMVCTWNFIRRLKPCAEALQWGEAKYKRRRSLNASTLIRALMQEKKLEWANWLIVRLMGRPQYLRYAIYASNQVIVHYRRYAPDDGRPQNAIQTTIQCLNDDSKANRHRAAVAAGAAEAAARATGANALDAEAAARATVWTARAASDDSKVNPGVAAGAAAWAVWAAAGAVGASDRNATWTAKVAAKKTMQQKILKYGVSLLRRHY